MVSSFSSKRLGDTMDSLALGSNWAGGVAIVLFLAPLALHLVSSYLFPSTSTVINSGRAWDIFRTTAKKRFRSDAARLLQNGFEKVSRRAMNSSRCRIWSTEVHCHASLLMPFAFSLTTGLCWSCRLDTLAKFAAMIASVWTISLPPFVVPCPNSILVITEWPV